MKNTRIGSIHLIVLTLLLAGTGLVGIVRAEDKRESKDIVAVASDARNFKTLVTAIKAAGLVETLQGTGTLHGLRAHGQGLRQVARRNRG